MIATIETPNDVQNVPINAVKNPSLDGGTMANNRTMTPRHAMPAMNSFFSFSMISPANCATAMQRPAPMADKANPIDHPALVVKLDTPFMTINNMLVTTLSAVMTGSTTSPIFFVFFCNAHIIFAIQKANPAGTSNNSAAATYIVLIASTTNHAAYAAPVIASNKHATFAPMRTFISFGICILKPMLFASLYNG